MPAPFSLSPSRIARYFFHDCELFLRFDAATSQTRQREELPEPRGEHSPLMTAIFSSGGDWEQSVVETHLKGKVHIAPGKGELSSRRFSAEQTLALLRKAKPGEYLYQTTLHAPASFYTRYGLDPALVLLSDNHPDLIVVEPGRRFRVIDVKKSGSVRFTHEVQVLLYALQLAVILEEERIEGTVDLDSGGVWLGQQAQPEWLDIRGIRPLLEEFLRARVAEVLRKPASECDWHVRYRCEWCEYFAHCRPRISATDDLSRLPHLTAYGKKFLQAEAGVRSTAELGAFLQQPASDARLERCASLAYRGHHLRAQVDALWNQHPVLHGGASPAVVKHEDLAVFVTIQQEPLSEAFYCAGLLVYGKDEKRQAVLGESGKSVPFVRVAESLDGVPRMRAEFITRLYDILDRTDAYNMGKVWGDQVSLQVYVHNEQERDWLVEMLMQALEDAELAPKAMPLLMNLQGPELIEVDKHPRECLQHPVVVLLNALGALLAMPVEVSHTLPETLQALGSHFEYKRNDYFHFPLGHTLRAEAIYEAWYQQKAERIPRVESMAGQQLYAQRSLLFRLRQAAAARIFSWPPKFYFAGRVCIKDPLLSRLYFLLRYESMLNCMGVRHGRAEARHAQLLRGTAIELESGSGGRMAVLSDSWDIEAGGMAEWLLVRDNESGWQAQLEYPDYAARNQPKAGKQHPDRAVVGIDDVQRDALGFIREIRLRYERIFAGGPPPPGQRFLLMPRFTDWNTDKVANFLEKCDAAPRNPFTEMLRAPEEFAHANALPDAVMKTAAKAVRAMHFTPSQEEAFTAIGRQRLTLVWGPPGTGKTHFLARMIAGYAAAHQKAGRPFRVLVTCFTHAAIENLLLKLLEAQQALGCEFAIRKGDHWQGSEQGKVANVPDEFLRACLDNNPVCVVGTTVYFPLKAKADLHAFDMVVIDEASQLRVPDSAVPALLASKEGRLVLAGDHLQLPPIVQGVYPDPEPGQPVLHRSIFEAVQCQAREGSGLVQKLKENFRMNDVLTGVAGSLLYGSDYRCASDEIAHRRLPLASLPADDVLRACLDPAFPLAVVVLDGVTPARESEVEADIVAGLVTWLREHTEHATDKDFFRKGVFIVSPHHTQIRLIRRALSQRRQWTTPPFVDTVEKMQGREADAVIVSYGVSDPEYAMQEAEFIYSVNRLNVSLTRGRTKSILLISRALLEGSAGVWENKDAAAGLNYLVRLTAMLREAGDCVRCGDVEVMRASATRAAAV